MQNTLEVRAFFFNMETDYLPYYKNFSITLNSEDPVEKILASIKEQNENFAYPEEKLIFKINDLVVEGSQDVGSVVAKLGTTLQIDPVLSYRSNHCLIINDDDFMEKFELLSAYASEEDKKYFESMYALHYASESYKFTHDYVGDAILLLAHKMIKDGSEHKEEILRAISDEHEGMAACEYENNLFNAEYHTKEIEELNEMVTYKSTLGILEKCSQTMSKKALYSFDKDNIEGVNVSCYAGDSSLLEEIHEKIEKNGGNVLNFQRETKLAGTSIVDRQKNLAFLKAATTLLNALDTGAELLVVAKRKDYEMFTENFASIQKRIGREIPLPIISYKDFSALLNRKKVLEEA
ncbi:hypothetical protein MNB_SV-5-1697 [hydrothermal vent metagenome]|uniref:DUF5644 domain-containing protein n=1 Tax=hydrothermal vent metagenome TaxID=652676 RepID=A0A1W1EBH4_9ZZZZ